MSQGNEQSVESRSPEQIRAEIETTREEMGETVAAVAAKTDVKAQAKAKVDGVKEQAKAKVEDVKAQAQEKAGEVSGAAKELGREAKAAAPSSPGEGTHRARALVEENPKPFGIGGVVLALFVIWRLLRR